MLIKHFTAADFPLDDAILLAYFSRNFKENAQKAYTMWQEGKIEVAGFFYANEFAAFLPYILQDVNGKRVYTIFSIELINALIIDRTQAIQAFINDYAERPCTLSLTLEITEETENGLFERYINDKFSKSMYKMRKELSRNV